MAARNYKHPPRARVAVGPGLAMTSSSCSSCPCREAREGGGPPEDFRRKLLVADRWQLAVVQGVSKIAGKRHQGVPSSSAQGVAQAN